MSVNDCLSLSVSNSKEKNKRRTKNERTHPWNVCLSWLTDFCVGVRYVMKEILLDPIDMTEELMFHMFNNDMNRELDGEFLDLYLSLQHYKEHLEKLEEE